MSAMTVAKSVLVMFLLMLVACFALMVAYIFTGTTHPSLLHSHLGALAALFGVTGTAGSFLTGMVLMEMSI